MSLKLMKRKCCHCGKSYSFNPDTGDLGLMCPHCNKPQNVFPDKAENGNENPDKSKDK